MSISIPRDIVQTFGLEADVYFNVTLGIKDETVQFKKLLRKCGTKDLIIYIPMKVAQGNKDKGLVRGALADVTLEEV